MEEKCKVIFEKEGKGKILISATLLNKINIKDTEKIRIILDEDEMSLNIVKNFGDFYYIEGEKDFIDVSCSWAITEIDNKKVKLIFGGDGIFLGFENKEDINLYNEKLEYKKWDEYKIKGTYR